MTTFDKLMLYAMAYDRRPAQHILSLYDIVCILWWKLFVFYEDDTEISG